MIRVQRPPFQHGVKETDGGLTENTNPFFSAYLRGSSANSAMKRAPLLLAVPRVIQATISLLQHGVKETDGGLTEKTNPFFSAYLRGSSANSAMKGAPLLLAVPRVIQATISLLQHGGKENHGGLTEKTNPFFSAYLSGSSASSAMKRAPTPRRSA